MKRLCIVCGARVTNSNPKANTCDPICTFARDTGISRVRAQKLLNRSSAKRQELEIYYQNKREKEKSEHIKFDS